RVFGHAGWSRWTTCRACPRYTQARQGHGVLGVFREGDGGGVAMELVRGVSSGRWLGLDPPSQQALGLDSPPRPSLRSLSGSSASNERGPAACAPTAAVETTTRLPSSELLTCPTPMTLPCSRTRRDLRHPALPDARALRR